jgi:hypothetical protein
MILRSAARLSTVILSALVVSLLCLAPRPAIGGGTPATGTTSDQLINQQGSGVLTEWGDYIASTDGAGLDSAYSYWLEVPPGLSRLVIEIFDADVYAGGNGDLAGDRDREITGSASVEYRLFDPSGTEVTTTNFTDGDDNSPANADNAWLVFFDTQSVASFADVTTATNTVPSVPVYESQSTASESSNDNTLTISRPPGTTAGDFLVAIVSTDGNVTHAASGWTAIGQGQSPGGQSTLSLWYRAAGGSEPASYDFTWSGGQEAAGGILRYSNVDTSDPIDVAGGNTGSSTSPTAPSVTTTVDNAMVLRVYSADDDDIEVGDPYPSGANGRFNIQSGGGGGTTSAGAADAVQVTAGATGTAAFALSGYEQWIAATVAIAPGAADLEALTMTTPTSTQSGDLLIATVVTDGDVTVSTPSGWTSIDQGQSDSDASTLGVWYRVADGTESTTYTFTWTGDQEAAGSISRYIGVDTSDPIDGSDSDTGTSTTPTAPSVTASNANSVVLRIFGSDGSETSTEPTGTTERFGLTSSATAGDATTTSGADAVQAAAGGSGTASFTLGASQEWRALTVVINSDSSLGTIDNGHWELRVDMSSSVTNGTAVNAFGLRAHDGNSGSGGREINIYTDSFIIVGVNENDRSRDYDYFPYVTSGCGFDISNFDFDDDGSLDLTSRTGSYTQSVTDMSDNDEWTTDNFSGWTSLETADDYGTWYLDVNIGDYGSGNYGPLYVQSSAAAVAPPTSQPEDDTFRIYFPTDSGGGPPLPYLAQYLTYVNGSGDNPPTSGSTTRYAVTIQAVNPTGSAGSITYSSSNLVSAWVPSMSVTYQGLSWISQGSIVTQPSVGGSGLIEWNPGTVTPGTTAVMVYQVEVTGTGSDIVVTGAPGSGNGTRSAYRDHTGNSSQARATVALGELCQLEVDGAAATHTLVTSFEARATTGGVTVEWTTAAEAGTIGFDLLRFDEMTRAWWRVNSRVLSGLMTPQGGTYRLLDPGASFDDRSTYMLVEHDSAGRSNLVGPFMPELRWDGHRDPPVGDFERLARRTSPRRNAAEKWATSPRNTLQSSTMLRRPTGRRSPARRNGALKIAVREAGLYRVGAAEIGQQLGYSTEEVEQLLGRGGFSLTDMGQPVAWSTTDDGAALEFYGTGVDSIYTEDNIYRLARGRGLMMEKRAGAAPGAAVDDGSFRDSIHFERDLQAVVLLPLDPRGDTWFWDYVYADDPDHLTATFDLTVQGVSETSTGPFDLAVHLQGGSSDEHEVEIWLNGEWIDNVEIDRTDEATAVFESLSNHLLAEGSNTLEVKAVSGGVVFIDSVDLAYDRAFRAEGGRDLLHSAEGQSRVTVRGFSGPEIRVFDLRDAYRPIELTDLLIDGDDTSGYRVTYEPLPGAAASLALTPEAVRVPVGFTPDVSSDLRSSSNTADYVVITTADLMEAAQNFAELRRSSGLETLVVDLADIYDEFNHGLADPNSIRDFLTHAYENWAVPPRYVLLAGAGSWDFKDNLGSGGNLIPPLMTTTSETIPSIFATDALYADVVGDDGVPELAIGRVPVLTAQELDAYTDKVADYENGATSKRVLMLADDPDRGGDFSADSDRLSNVVPGGFESSKIYLEDVDIDSARELLFEQIQGGVGLVNYLGHGGLVNFADEGLLTSDDLPLLDQASLAPVITTFSCYIGYFAIPGFDSLGELLTVEADGGAAAVIAPNYLSQNAQARVLNDRFFRELFQEDGLVIGDVFRRALEKAAGSVEKTTLQKYGILGDPALRLQLEPGEVEGNAGGSGGLG